MSDYVVNLHNASPRTFTVVFQSKQVNSTEHAIHISEDSILEGNETFRLRIVAARFIGQAADIFRAQDGLHNTFADVIIKDDDCEFSMCHYTIPKDCLQICTSKSIHWHVLDFVKCFLHQLLVSAGLLHNPLK